MNLHLTEAWGTTVDVGSTGDKASWAPGRPVNIVRWGFMVHTNLVSGASFAMTLDHRPTIASDTGRTNGSVAAGVDTAGGSITLTGNANAGKGRYHNVVAANGFHVDPGEEVVFEVTDAATSGAVFLFIEYQALPFVGDGTATESDANRIFNMTKVAS